MKIIQNVKRITLGVLGTAILASGLWACSDDNDSRTEIDKNQENTVLSNKIHERKKYDALNMALLNEKQDIFEQVNNLMSQMDAQEKTSYTQGILSENTTYTLTDVDVDLLKRFSFYYENNDNDMTKSIALLEKDILSIELTEIEYSRYSFWISTLKLSVDYMNESKVEEIIVDNNLKYAVLEPWFYNDNNNSQYSTYSWWDRNKGNIGCAAAVAGNALATYGLVACVVPNPTSPAGCATAVIGKGLSLLGVYAGC